MLGRGVWVYGFVVVPMCSLVWCLWCCLVWACAKTFYVIMMLWWEGEPSVGCLFSSVLLCFVGSNMVDAGGRCHRGTGGRWLQIKGVQNGLRRYIGYK